MIVLDIQDFHTELMERYFQQRCRRPIATEKSILFPYKFEAGETVAYRGIKFQVDEIIESPPGQFGIHGQLIGKDGKPAGAVRCWALNMVHKC